MQTRFPTSLLVLARAAFGEDVGPAIAQCETALGSPLPVDPTDIDQSSSSAPAGRSGWRTRPP